MVRLNRYHVNGFLVALALFFGCGLAWSAPASYTFTTVDIPLTVTFNGEIRHDIVLLTDINNRGELVGSDFASEGLIVPPALQVTEIRCPGDRTDDSNPASASAINNRGAVVGTCTSGVSPAARSVGFVRDRLGTFTLLTFPGADGMNAWGINDLGHVVGEYWGDQVGDGFHGFIWHDGVYTTLDAPFEGAMNTTLWGINNAGQIIGTYWHHRPGSSDINDSDQVAFLYTQGTFTQLDFPGATLPYLCCGATTFPLDINNRGQVLGSTYDSAGMQQFFLYEAGTYLVLTGVPPNVVGASNSGGRLNDQGEIAGTYVQRLPCERCGLEGEPSFTYEVHSFIATPSVAPPPTNRVITSFPPVRK